MSQAVIKQTVFSANAEAGPSTLRVALCGSLWYGTTCFGREKTSLFELQALLDARWPFCLDVFEGDFVLCYLSPNLAYCCFYRGVTATHTLYYRVIDQTGIVWSTTIHDLFLGAFPTLDDVDREMIPLLASTAQPVPGRTCYRQIKSLPAGTSLCFDQDGTMSSFQHDLTVREENSQLPLASAARRFRELVEISVQRCFQGCSEANVFLSGGMDTAVVAYEASKIASHVRGFHWTWDLPIFRDERACAEQIAHHLGIHLSALNFGASISKGGNYLKSMQGLTIPYNHAFFHCFAEVARVAAQDHAQVIASGHLGDTGFQGDWADPFRASLSTRHPFSLLRTATHLLSWYPRAHAATVFLYLLGEQRDLTAHSGQDRIQPCAAWMTPSAFKVIREQGFFDYRQHFAQWRDYSLSTYMVRVNLQDALEGETNLDNALTAQAFLPHKLIRAHPFSDRRLLEFCLSLGPQHRQGFYAGRPITKVLMRLAYLNDLPPLIIRREVRCPYSSVAEYYCRENRDELQELFSPRSVLAQFGMIEPQKIEEIVTSPTSLQYHSRWFVRAAAVEIWLRTLGGIALPLTKDNRVSSPRVSYKERTIPDQQVSHTPLARTNTQVMVHTINDIFVLIHQQTKKVHRLNQAGTYIFDLLLTHSSWEQAVNQLHCAFEAIKSVEDTKEMLFSFALLLAQEGWIHIQQPPPEDAHALPAHN
jgi:asparagine synthetase B (glutamine-hydrolysing)